MMKQRSFLLTLFFPAVLVSSCDPVVIDKDLPDGSAKLCINSYFLADSTVKVHITRGKHILNTDLGNTTHEPVNGATITISGGDKLSTTLSPAAFPGWWGIVEESHLKKKDGWYESSSGFSAGETCQIMVSAEGMESISAACYIPQPVPLLKAEIVSMVYDENGQIPVDVYFSDPPETKNYYHIVMRAKRVPRPGVLPPRFDGQEILVRTDDPLFSFDPEPFSLNGDRRLRPVLFADDRLNGKSIKVRCMVNHNPEGYLLQVELQSISKEYYLHKTTEALQEATADDPFAQPVQVYSNVKNGFGIFAGASCSVITIDL